MLSIIIKDSYRIPGTESACIWMLLPWMLLVQLQLWPWTTLKSSLAFYVDTPVFEISTTAQGSVIGTVTIGILCLFPAGSSKPNASRDLKPACQLIRSSTWVDCDVDHLAFLESGETASISLGFSFHLEQHTLLRWSSTMLWPVPGHWVFYPALSGTVDDR